MNKLFTPLSFLFLLFFASAQAQTTNPYCDGVRYKDQVFTTTTVTSGVQYGQNTGYCGEAYTLLMDIYQPEGDTATARPVLFVNYGGSFINGTRTDGYVVDICQDFAKRGYVTCAIDYRVFALCSFPDSAIMLDVVVKAVGDQKAGIRFLREHASEYKVDTNFVFLSGVSAGGILALHAAYIDNTSEVPSYVSTIIDANGGIEGNSSANFQYSSKVQGVWNMSGGLHKKEWLDADDPLLISIHETQDPTVPYAHGFAQVSGLNLVSLDGSSLLKAQEVANAKSTVFFSIANAGHTAYLSKAPIMDSLSNSAAALFESILCGNTAPNFEASMPLNFNPSGINDVQADLFSLSPNPVQGEIKLSLKNTSKGYSVNISDQLGRKVFEQTNLSQSSLQIPRGNLKTGLYFVTVTSNEQTAQTLKVILE
jgi:para-nitrobenzyl esterase